MNINVLILNLDHAPECLKSIRTLLTAPTIADVKISTSREVFVQSLNSYDIGIILIDKPEDSIQIYLENFIRYQHKPRLLLVSTRPTTFMHQLAQHESIEFLTWPFTKLEFQQSLSRLDNPSHSALGILKKYGIDYIIGNNAEFVKQIRRGEKFAKQDVNVLIYGETGTGKELMARAIHQMSNRSAKPFHPINCASIPANFLESKLFGHVKGAFTGASEDKDGIVQRAAHGTLFLDEIDIMNVQSQGMLLRFLENKEYRRMGDPTLLHADVRFLAATQNNLSKLVQDEQFRQDLYFRVVVVCIIIPPLRNRLDDIEPLVKHFLSKQPKIKGIDTDVISYLKTHDWPGNVRELANTIHRAVVESDDDIIHVKDIEFLLTDPEAQTRIPPLDKARDETLNRFEKQYIYKLLKKTKGDLDKAAEIARIKKRTLIYHLNKYDIDPKDIT